MKTFKKILLLFLCLALAAELGFLGIMMMKEPSGPADPTEATAPATQAPTQAPTEPPTEAPTEEPTEPPTEGPTEPPFVSYTFTFAGDCTLASDSGSYNSAYGFIQTIGEDYGFPFRNVLEYFENDELTVLNLEGALTEEGYAQQKDFSLRGPNDYVNILTQNSVEAVTLANDHTMDFGQTGYTSTKNQLDSAKIPYVERDSSTLITTKNGLKVGIYGAVYYKLDAGEITAAISKLRKEADIVIFAPHWGYEMNPKFNAEQEKIARAAVDAGADIVYGTHPRVLQAMESYKDAVIWYSLGSFSFGGNTNPGDYDSALIQQEVIRAADGSVSLGETVVVPVSISSVSDRNNFQPTPCKEGSEGYVRVLEKLDRAE